MPDTTSAPGGPGEAEDPPRTDGVTRRGLLRRTGAVGLGAAGAALLPGAAHAAYAAGGDPAGDGTSDAASATPAGSEASAASATTSRFPALAVSSFDPVRPPAVPLAVRSPYLSTWMPADLLAGNWPRFWTGRTTAMTGIARIDGVDHLFLGAPGVPGHPLSRGLVQRSLTVTATRSQYVLEGGGVELTLTFLSPVEPGDLRRQSVPLSYVLADVRSRDGKPHEVGLYFDISGEWAHGDSGTRIRWAQEQSSDGSLTSLSVTPDSPQVLRENGDMASWGTVVFSASGGPGLTWQIGADTVVRGAVLADGKLANTADSGQPRAISDRWPVFAFHVDLGAAPGRTRSAVLSVGHVREPAVSYLGEQLPPLWRSYWSSWQQMAQDFHADADAARTRTAALDHRVRQEATAAGGPKYAALCALSLRQAYAGTELVSRGGKPWAFLKEISSDGNVSTVDVTYPAMPVFLHLDPGYLRLLLEPLLDYAEHGGWPKEFAEHDLGSSYPNATGHNDGNEEDMPVEESANMLLMSAAYLARAGDAAGAFATAHYPVLRQWADYLVANALDPGYQNQTDDFTGFIAHSANLALKGILAIGAMGAIATAAGNAADATRYRSTARDYIAQWVAKAQDTTPDHLKLAYDQPGTWSLKYNGYPDALLGLGLVPDAAAREEADWYLTQANQFGVPLDPRHSYTKGDWEMWTAAWLRDHPVADFLIGALYDFAHTSPSRVPFTDLYDTVSGNQTGFQARPVVGGVFALLSLAR